MSDIFEEVEESVRKDKVAERWNKYGIFVWAAGLLIIAGVAYWEWSKGVEAKAVEARIERFESARQELLAGNYPEAQAAFKELMDGDTKLSALSAHYLAQAYYEGNGDKAAAADILRATAAPEGPVERIALIKSAYLRADEMSLGELENYLGAMPEENTALGVLALELIAAKALKEGDLARARKEFSYLRFAPNSPPGVAQRAEIALSVIPEVAEDEDEGAEPDPVDPDLDVEPAGETAEEEVPAVDEQENGQ